MTSICPRCGVGHIIDRAALRRIRLRKGLTLVQVSTRMGISFGYLGDLEKGRKQWNAKLAKSFTKATNEIRSHMVR